MALGLAALPEPEQGQEGGHILPGWALRAFVGLFPASKARGKQEKTVALCKDCVCTSQFGISWVKIAYAPLLDQGPQSPGLARPVPEADNLAGRLLGGKGVPE